MRLACFSILLGLIAARAATAHPHPGGIVIRRDGTVVVGDILGRRLLVIEPSGRLREVGGVGDIRGLASSSAGTVYGVSWQRGAGVWKLSADDQPIPILAGFNGLMAAGDQGSLILAPINEFGLGQRLVIRLPTGEQSGLASLSDITALTWHQGTTFVAAGSTVHTIDAAGAVKTLAADVGTGLYGLAMGRHGLIVTCYNQRQVMEIAPDGARRVLLTSDAPWGPASVAVDDDVLYVVELAEHPCCFKGPRIRRLLADETATTLLTIDDRKHFHFLPSERPFQWMVGTGIVTFIVFVLGVMRVQRRRPRAPISPNDLA